MRTQLPAGVSDGKKILQQNAITLKLILKKTLVSFGMDCGYGTSAKEFNHDACRLYGCCDTVMAVHKSGEHIECITNFSTWTMKYTDDGSSFPFVFI